MEGRHTEARRARERMGVCAGWYIHRFIPWLPITTTVASVNRRLRPYGRATEKANICTRDVAPCRCRAAPDSFLPSEGREHPRAAAKNENPEVSRIPSRLDGIERGIAAVLLPCLSLSERTGAKSRGTRNEGHFFLEPKRRQYRAPSRIQYIFRHTIHAIPQFKRSNE